MNHQESLIDTHTHLASSRFSGDVSSVIERASEAGISKLVAISCDIEDSETNLELARTYSCVAPTAGIHPLYVHEVDSESWFQRLEYFARSKPIAAIGEIGLDYYHPPQNGASEAEWRILQHEIFERQLQLAQDHEIPVVIHQRESASDVASVLKRFPKVKAVLHCFTGTISEAEEALSMGHYLSFTGIITFPSAESVREVAAMVPLDRIMVETDSPYLAPVPFRGKQCEPAMVVHTASKLAGIRGISDTELASLTTANAIEFFNHLCR